MLIWCWGVGVRPGRFNDHHAFLRGIILRRIDELAAVIEEVTSRIDAELVPFDDAVEHLVTVPGIDRKGAAVIIAEPGSTDVIGCGSES